MGEGGESDGIPKETGIKREAPEYLELARARDREGLARYISGMEAKVEGLKERLGLVEFGLGGIGMSQAAIVLGLPRERVSGVFRGKLEASTDIYTNAANYPGFDPYAEFDQLALENYRFQQEEKFSRGNSQSLGYIDCLEGKINLRTGLKYGLPAVLRHYLTDLDSGSDTTPHHEVSHSAGHYIQPVGREMEEAREVFRKLDARAMEGTVMSWRWWVDNVVRGGVERIGARVKYGRAWWNYNTEFNKIAFWNEGGNSLRALSEALAYRGECDFGEYQENGRLMDMLNNHPWLDNFPPETKEGVVKSIWNRLRATVAYGYSIKEISEAVVIRFQKWKANKDDPNADNRAILALFDDMIAKRMATGEAIDEELIGELAHIDDLVCKARSVTMQKAIWETAGEMAVQVWTTPEGQVLDFKGNSGPNMVCLLPIKQELAITDQPRMGIAINAFAYIDSDLNLPPGLRPTNKGYDWEYRPRNVVHATDIGAYKIGIDGIDYKATEAEPIMGRAEAKMLARQTYEALTVEQRDQLQQFVLSPDFHPRVRASDISQGRLQRELVGLCFASAEGEQQGEVVRVMNELKLAEIANNYRHYNSLLASLALSDFRYSEMTIGDTIEAEPSLLAASKAAMVDYLKRQYGDRWRQEIVGNQAGDRLIEFLESQDVLGGRQVLVGATQGLVNFRKAYRDSLEDVSEERKTMMEKDLARRVLGLGSSIVNSDQNPFSDMDGLVVAAEVANALSHGLTPIISRVLGITE